MFTCAYARTDQCSGQPHRPAEPSRAESKEPITKAQGDLEFWNPSKRERVRITRVPSDPTNLPDIVFENHATQVLDVKNTDITKYLPFWMLSLEGLGAKSSLLFTWRLPDPTTKASIDEKMADINSCLRDACFGIGMALVQFESLVRVDLWPFPRTLQWDCPKPFASLEVTAGSIVLETFGEL